MSLAEIPMVLVLFGQQEAAGNIAAGNIAAGRGGTAMSELPQGSGSATFWALLLAIIGLTLLLPASTRRRRAAGALLAVLSLLLILVGMTAPLANSGSQAVFGALAAVTLVSAVAAVATPSPVYTAIWFALSLLGTAGLLMYEGAQFLSVATLAVYAGAIVVTFLFVIMLAQPEGHAPYDRMTWGWYTKSASALIAALLVGVLSFAIRTAYDPSAVSAATPREVLHPAHMARFGSELFGKHLLSVEIAGSLLLVALVGGMSIMMQAGQLSTEGLDDE